jgi:DNA topoisomerase I
MKILVIVESPAKAKTIQKYLNSIDKVNEYTVKASFGHVRDLKSDELGIDIDRGFTPSYVISAQKDKVVKELLKSVKTADLVYLASDCDREGESIAWHISQLLPNNVKQQRITFHEITKNALENAIRNPRTIDMNMVNAQQARRMIDRIVGFKVSPILWKHFAAGAIKLSAGRVQSAALRLIVEREEEIEKYTSSPYWTILGNFDIAASIEGFEAKLVDSERSVLQFNTIDEAQCILSKLKNVFRLVDTKVKQGKLYPEPPFITSSLQQEAYNKLGMPVAMTMKYAQQLYESGDITYMRTDSYALSNDAHQAIRVYVTKQYGSEYYEHRDQGKKKSKGAQEAHEAIRPTQFDVNVDDIKKRHSVKHAQLYQLILNRTLASQMKPLVHEDLIIRFRDTSFAPTLWMEGKIVSLVFEGFMILYEHQFKRLDLKQLERAASSGQIKCHSMYTHNTWTSGPSRFNEASLVKCLEKEGIGRPSTYANIIEKLYEKQYIEKQNIPGKVRKCINLTWEPSKRISRKETESTTHGENGRIVPATIGRGVNSFLTDNFATITDKTFTSSMEDELDLIAQGDAAHQQVLTNFWQTLKPTIDANLQKKTQKTALKADVHVVMDNGVEYQCRVGKYGPVLEYTCDKITKYINLKPYLALVRKNLKDVNAADIQLLVKMPHKIGSTGASLLYGQYGFYVKDGADTGGINVKWIKTNLTSIYDIVNITPEQVQGLILQKKEAVAKKTVAKSNVTKKKDNNVPHKKVTKVTKVTTRNKQSNVN